MSYTYPGANANEVLNTVARPIEDEVNGVDDMLYMNGSCSDDGSYSLNISFEVESDRDMDMVKVQNRVSQAEAKLPEEVKQLGGRVRAKSEDLLGFMTVSSPTMTRLQVADYIYANIQPVLLRVPGVGDVAVYGPKLSMRVWLDPQRLAAQTLLQRLVAAVLGVAAGADDQLAPELPLPEADHPARVVQLPLKRLRRLTVHHVPRRLGLHPLIRKPSQRLTRQTQQTDVTQRRYGKAVLDAHGRFPPFGSIESVSPDGRGTSGSSPDGSLF